MIKVPPSGEIVNRPTDLLMVGPDGSEEMIDVSARGVRCRAAQEILDLEGTIGVATEGTIVYELEGEGGQLVHVQWDNGASSLVSSEEIEITDRGVIWQ